MPRETIDEKALRYVREGRVRIEYVDFRSDRRGEAIAVLARATGSDGEYALGYDSRRREWRCTCEASAKFRRRCSHLRAVQLVVKVPTERRGRSANAPASGRESDERPTTGRNRSGGAG